MIEIRRLVDGFSNFGWGGWGLGKVSDGGFE